MSFTHGDNQDPLGCAAQLRAVLAHPALQDTGAPSTPQQAQAALWLATAMGRCRVFGVPVHDVQDVLPVHMAAEAAKESIVQLRDQATLVAELSAKGDRGDMENDCALEAGRLFFVRMDLWAAYVAIDEAYESVVHGFAVDTVGLRALLEELIDATTKLDEAMEAHMDTLCTAAETNMFDNWRGLLAEPYRTAPPWWLDGTVEKAWAEVMAEICGNG